MRRSERGELGVNERDCRIAELSEKVLPDPAWENEARETTQADREQHEEHHRDHATGVGAHLDPPRRQTDAAVWTRVVFNCHWL